MKLVPVVEIVQIHRAGVAGAVVRQAARPEDALAGLIVVNVSPDGLVVFVESRLVEFDAGLLLHPRLELRIGRAAVRDELLDRVRAEAEGGAGHGVVALAQAGITGGEFAARFERAFEPKAREVKDAERTGNAGTDQGDMGCAHLFGLLIN